VLILSAEDSCGKTVKGRCMGMPGWEKAQNHIYAGDEPFGFDMPGVNFIEYMIERHNIKLVIIDPFMSFTEKKDMNQTHEVKQIMSPMNKVAQRNNCVILLINHLNKSTSQAAQYRSIGSIGILGSVRSQFLVGEDPNDRTRVALVHAKSNLAVKGETLLYRVKQLSLTEGEFRWEGTSDLNKDTLLAQANSKPTQGEEIERWPPPLATSTAIFAESQPLPKPGSPEIITSSPSGK